MKRPGPFIPAVAVLGAVMLLAAASYFSAPAQKGLRLDTLVVEGAAGSRHSFEVEIADTPQMQAIGLMFRERMDPDHGMLFTFAQERVVKFWMKNTPIPLDMLFIAADGEIKKIHENAVPESLEGIGSEVPVAGVLEINGGRAKALGIVNGDKVIHPYFKETE